MTALTKKIKPRYTKGDKTRAKIIEQAARQFSEHGYSGVALADIMSACDLTKGGFYAYFPSKEALYIESIRTILAREQLKYQRAPDTAPPEERLRAFLNWMGDSLAGNKPLGRQFLWMLLEKNPNVTKHVIDRMFQPTYQELSSLLALRYSSVDSEVIAHGLLAIALLYEQIKARIMQPLVNKKSAALKFDTATVLDFLLDHEHGLFKQGQKPTASRKKSR